MHILIRWVLNALSLYIVANVVPGIQLTDFGAALIAVIFIGLVNSLLKPLLLLLTLPINVLALGLFTFIINAGLLKLAAGISPDFQVDSWGAAILGSILLSVISTILHSLVR